MPELKYKRILLKVSGEALAGDAHRGLDFTIVNELCKSIKTCVDMGVQIGLVIGAGNFWRGVKDGAGKVERVSADRMGMLATCMNCPFVSPVISCNFRSVSLDGYSVPSGIMRLTDPVTSLCFPFAAPLVIVLRCLGTRRTVYTSLVSPCPSAKTSSTNGSCAKSTY